MMMNLNQKMMMYKLRQNKEKILITFLFVLGIYHLLMFGIKMNIFNMTEYQIDIIRPILYKFYHLAYNSIIIIAVLFVWIKRIYWIFLYFGLKVLYNLITFINPLRDALDQSLIDGVSFGVLIIVILILLSNEKNR